MFGKTPLDFDRTNWIFNFIDKCYLIKISYFSQIKPIHKIITLRIIKINPNENNKNWKSKLGYTEFDC